MHSSAESDPDGPTVVLASEGLAASHDASRLGVILDSLHEGMILLHADGSLERVNVAARQWLGPIASEVEGDPHGWLARLQIREVEGLDIAPEQLIANVLAGTPIEDLHLRLPGPDGLRIVRINARPLPESVGGGAVLTMRDVTGEREAEDALRREARRDPLTDLPNRRAFAEAVQAAGTSDVVVLVDLERFKPVNDRLGHHVGDIVLLTLGARLRVGIRAGDIAARVGGDEFAVLLRRVRDDEVEELQERVRTVLERPIEAEGVLLQVGASVGSTRVRAGEEPSETMRRADEAMYRDKRLRHARQLGREHRSGD
jgi:diguanylate cyclase (GGDEF)-like protein